MPQDRAEVSGARTVLSSFPQARGSGISQVSADGGAATLITALDAGRGRNGPPVTRAVAWRRNCSVCRVRGDLPGRVDCGAVAETGERRVLIEGASLPHYASTGHMLYVQPKRPGTIMAVAFDVETLELAGMPVPVVEGVLTDRGDHAHWSLSRSGMLVYAPGGFKEAENNLVFVDRQGIATPVGTPLQRPYHFPRLSPDGRRVAVTLAGIQSTLWIYERSGSAFNRLTFAGNNDWAVWTPDGKRVTYASNRAEPWRLFWKPFDGSGKEELLLARETGDQQPYSWSADGKVLVYSEATPAAQQDIWVMPIRRSPASAHPPDVRLGGGCASVSRWPLAGVRL